MLILDGGPQQPFNKDIVIVAAFTIHADLNSMPLQHFDKCGAQKLNALAGIHDLRASVDLNHRIHCLHTEIIIHDVG